MKRAADAEDKGEPSGQSNSPSQASAISPRLAAWWGSIPGTYSCDKVALPSSSLLHLQLPSPLAESERQEPRAINSVEILFGRDPNSSVKAHVKLRCLCPTQGPPKLHFFGISLIQSNLPPYLHRL